MNRDLLTALFLLAIALLAIAATCALYNEWPPEPGAVEVSK